MKWKSFTHKNNIPHTYERSLRYGTTKGEGENESNNKNNNHNKKYNKIK